MIDASPLLLILYLAGTSGILFTISDLLSVNASTTFLLIGFSLVLNTVFWYLYTRHGNLFIILSAVLTFIAGIILVPQVYQVTVHMKIMISRGLPLTNLPVDTLFVLLFAFLITFFLFALEFIIRSHVIMLVGGLVLLLLVPVFDHSMNILTLLLIGTYEIGFIVVNMSERRSSRSVMTMHRRSVINAASVVLALAVILLITVPALILEKCSERQLFEAAYATDSFIKDTVARLTGGSADSSVNNGNINRGNLYQSGRKQLAITLDHLPVDTLYLKGFTGRNYSDSNWSNAFVLNLESDYGNATYKEPFMDTVIQEVYSDYRGEIPYSFYYLIYDSSDPISEMYYLLADTTTFNDNYFEEVEIGDTRYLQVNAEEEERGYLLNSEAASLWIRRLTNSTSGNIYCPYFFQKSESRILNKLSARGSYGNSYLTEAQANAAEHWESNPIYNLLADTYQRFIQWEYTEYPNDQTRMLELCRSEPLTDLNEITTFILVTLQNKAVYTTTPGNTPYNKDVIDYFLFDNGQGYCVHFASAAAMMYRMYGIPARYVTGYVATAADFSPSEQYEGYFSGSLTDKSAHAWVEIYLKDYGWVPVEVTPNSSGTMSASYPGYNQTIMRSIMARHHWTFRGETADSTDNTDNNGGGAFAAWTANAFTVVMIILPIALVIFIGAVLIRRRKVLSSLPKQSCRQLFDRIMHLLHYSKLLKNYTGSEEDFAEQLSSVTSLSSEDTDRLIRILLEANYAPAQPPPADRDFVESIYRTLSAELYTRTPLLKKPFFKFFHAFL